MRDTDPRIVEEYNDEFEQVWHRCVICKLQWRPREPAVHHERCGIGNLQRMVQGHIDNLAYQRRRAAERVHEAGTRRNVELGRWRTWAQGLVGRIGKYASDAALRFRVEDSIRPGQSALERGLRAQIAALEERLAEILDRDREFDAIKTEVTRPREAKGGP